MWRSSWPKAPAQFVTPAKAGVHADSAWMPAFAGMTEEGLRPLGQGDTAGAKLSVCVPAVPLSGGAQAQAGHASISGLEHAPGNGAEGPLWVPTKVLLSWVPEVRS